MSAILEKAKFLAPLKSDPFVWICPIFTGETSNQEAEQVTEKLEEHIQQLIAGYDRLFGNMFLLYHNIPKANVGAWHHTRPLVLPDNHPLEAQQTRWIFKNFYLQMGFLDLEIMRQYGLDDQDAVDQPFMVEIFDAMMKTDSHYCTTGCINPGEQFRMSRQDDYSEEALIHCLKVFDKGIGLWRVELVDFRNAMLIGIRALLEERDPEQEYERFLKLGGRHFLDYPGLCL